MTLVQLQTLFMEIAAEARSVRTDLDAIGHLFEPATAHMRRPARKGFFRCPQTR